MTETKKIFQQTLVVETDLQLLIDVIYQATEQLGGSLFGLTRILPKQIEVLRAHLLQSNEPILLSLLVHESQLLLQFVQHTFFLLDLTDIPSDKTLHQLQQQLEDAMQLLDPQALLQHNLALKQHFEQEKNRLESAFAQLQHSLEVRQKELETAVVQAETDALTGLLNRRSFDVRVKQAFLHTMRQRQFSLSLIFFDLDYFKQINDTHGHQYGDAYLNKMARALREIIRENVDMAFRFGGDEFAVLIFADIEQAAIKAQQVLQVMDHKSSIGIACICPDSPEDLTLEQFIFQTDQALYEAKRNGRGQVVLANSL